MKGRLDTVFLAEPSLAALDNFLSAVTEQDIRKTLLKVKPYEDLFFDQVQFQPVSLLAMTAKRGKIDHVRIILEDNPEYMDVLAAFFRALERGHKSVVFLLLEHIDIDHIAQIHLLSNIAGIRAHGYLNKIIRPDHYALRYNMVPAVGNVALIIAAGLHSSELFDLLIDDSQLKAQIPRSALAMFLAATRTPDGVAKKHINLDIVFLLLKYPVVYQYASTRIFDFGALLSAFDESKRELSAQKKAATTFCVKLFDSFPSLTSLTSAEDLSSMSETTSMRAPSSMDDSASGASMSPYLS